MFPTDLLYVDDFCKGIYIATGKIYDYDILANPTR